MFRSSVAAVYDRRKTGMVLYELDFPVASVSRKMRKLGAHRPPLQFIGRCHKTAGLGPNLSKLDPILGF